MNSRLITASILAIFASLSTGSIAFAETQFVADELSYDTNTGEAILIGNVEIQNEQGYFYIEKLIYHSDTGRIEIIGKVQAVLTTGERVQADYALLDPKQKLIFLKNARIYLENELQITAARLEDREKTTYGENVTASTCRVCSQGETPIWQIKSDQVVRDKENEKIYFKNARLEVFGFPIAFVPQLRIPDANVERMSGFLTPTAIISNLYLTGVRIPYYHVLNDHSDIKVTAYLTTKDVANFETVYRNEFVGGNIEIDGAFSVADGQGEFGRFYIMPTLEAELWEGWNLNAQYFYASDFDFAPEFGYANPNRNFATLSYFDKQNAFVAEFSEYRALSEAAKSSAQTYVLPHIRYENLSSLGNRTMVSSAIDVLNLQRDNALDYKRLSGTFEISHQFDKIGYFDLDATIGAKSQFYRIEDELAAINGNAQRITPFGSINLALPLTRERGDKFESLTPHIQLTTSKTYSDGVDVPNIDANFIEYDYVSLFSLNRFSGEDQIEEGLRLNLGADYSATVIGKSQLDIGFGKTFRLEDWGTDYGTRGNEWVGYANFTSQAGTSLYWRGATDSEFKFSRSEFGVNISQERFDLNLDLVSLAAEPELGFDSKRSELNFDGTYQFHDHWLVDFGLSYDLAGSQPFNSSLGLTYGNECIEATLGATTDFNRGEGIADETRLALTVTFVGLGGKSKKDWQQRRCANE